MEQPATQPDIKPKLPFTVMVRGIPEEKWKAVRLKADKQGRKLRSVMEEMIDDWLKKK